MISWYLELSSITAALQYATKSTAPIQSMTGCTTSELRKRLAVCCERMKHSSEDIQMLSTGQAHTILRLHNIFQPGRVIDCDYRKTLQSPRALTCNSSPNARSTFFCLFQSLGILDPRHAWRISTKSGNLDIHFSSSYTRFADNLGLTSCLPRLLVLKQRLVIQLFECEGLSAAGHRLAQDELCEV